MVHLANLLAFQHGLEGKSCAASDWPMINPVSCWGKKPLGMIT